MQEKGPKNYMACFLQHARYA